MHPLDGPRLKVWRAKGQLYAFRTVEHAFIARAPYKAYKAEFNPKTGRDVYRVRIRELPPWSWGAFVSEIAHNLRSALDNLVWQLALLNPKTKTPARRTQFPIFLYGRTALSLYRRRGEHSFWGKQRGDGMDILQSLTPEHQALLERLQPYKRGRGDRSNVLYLLREINNADKHRLLPIVGLRPGASPFVSAWVPDDMDDLTFWNQTNWRVRVMLENGAKLGEVARNMTVGQNFLPLIAFWEGCDPVKGLSVHLTLSRILDETREIIESFAPEFG